MIQVNVELTRKVADLARLELSEAEVNTFTGQLGNILKYVDQLSTADVAGVEPLTHALDLMAPLREDHVVPSPRDSQGHPKVLDSAPETVHDGYKVPPIL